MATEDLEILQQHGINNNYHVGFPLDEEAIEILCGYAFRQRSPLYGFKVFCGRIIELCGNLPLALRVVGSYLRGKMEDEWEDVMNRLETVVDREIKDVLRKGYESDIVKAMFADGKLVVKRGLKILLNRSLIDTYGERIEMHKLLQQMARQAIRKQEPWKHQILMDTFEICDVLENETGTSVVSGISFDVSGISELIVSKRAFKRMSNLRFLAIYKSIDDGNDGMHLPVEMEFPRCLRLLQWTSYPNKCLPSTFHPENLVNLCMRYSKLEYLWQGIQPLTNLKKMDLTLSCHLKELPDLSNARNLEKLDLSVCESLVEIPSSFTHLQNLKDLRMGNCINLQVIPPQLNLHPLKTLTCKEIEDVSALRLFPRLACLSIKKSGEKGLPHLPRTLWYQDLSYTDIEKLPGSLKSLTAEDCESLETVFCPLNHSSDATLVFTNCFKLDQQAQKEVIQYGDNSLSALSRLNLCVVVSPNHQTSEYNNGFESLCCRIGNRDLDPVEEVFRPGIFSKCRGEHIFIFNSRLPFISSCKESREIVFEFSCSYNSFDIIECGVHIWTEDELDSISLTNGRCRSNFFGMTTPNGVICDSKEHRLLELALPLLCSI
ncbi:hypothetical protein F2Q70_00001327 [Brassica cretica]|uniref:NB-ARC domain-containing protein n=1 Tax=Brassica cretica TaxID=69181 RepID=A0A8S9IWA1_BRACR|nr:hypothetical protein F2Q70_00001327 [Brassica cretica]